MASAFLNRTPAVAPAASCDHDRHRRGQTERTGAGDDEHGDCVDDRVRHSWFGPDPRPDTERQNRSRDHRGHEVSGDDIRELLNRSPAALSLGDELHDPREQRVGAHTFGADEERAGAVDASLPITRSARFFRRGLTRR